MNHNFLSENFDRENYRATIRMLVKRMASELGKAEGYAYAETFRVERAGGLARIVEEE